MGLVLLVLAVVFILENRVTTTVRFLVPRVSAPLWVALLVSALAGVMPARCSPTATTGSEAPRRLLR